MDMDEPSLVGWLAVVRAVHFGCCLLIAAVWIFDTVIATRSVASWRRIAFMLLAVTTPLALLSGAAWFLLVAANMSDLPFFTAIKNPQALHLVWSHTRFGRTWQIHMGFWTSGAIGALIWTRFQCGNRVNLISGSGLVAGLAWAGHGDTGPLPGWHSAADVLHLLASAAWPAGLVPFVIVLVSISRSTAPDRWEILRQITRRFSISSLTAVAMLTATGLVNSWCLLGSFNALVSTNYGRVLGIKIVLFVIMVTLGSINLLVLKPRLTLGEPVAVKLRLNVMIEIVLAAMVIAVVGLLGLLEPARN
jgi:putative copper resistance protein D